MKNFVSDVFTKRQQKIVLKNISAHTICTVLIFRTSQKYSSCDTVPLTFMVNYFYTLVFNLPIAYAREGMNDYIIGAGSKGHI